MAPEAKSAALQTNMDVDYVLVYRYASIGKDLKDFGNVSY